MFFLGGFVGMVVMGAISLITVRWYTVQVKEGIKEYLADEYDRFADEIMNAEKQMTSVLEQRAQEAHRQMADAVQRGVSEVIVANKGPKELN